MADLVIFCCFLLPNVALAVMADDGSVAAESRVLADSILDADDTSTTRSHRLLLAHAVCGSLAAMVFLPLGVLIPRYARGLSGQRWWLPVHGAVNGVLGGAFIIATYALSQQTLGTGGGDDSSSHTTLGLVLFILILVQIVLGALVHAAKSRTPDKLRTRTGRGPVNFVHVVLGGAIVTIGWIQVYTGLTQEWPDASGTGPAKRGWKIGWAVLVGVSSVSYLAGLAWLLPRQIRMERQMCQESKSG